MVRSARIDVQPLPCAIRPAFTLLYTVRRPDFGSYPTTIASTKHRDGVSLLFQDCLSSKIVPPFSER